MCLSLAREATRAGGTYNNGDRAVVDDDGYVTFLGRGNDTVSVDGEEVDTGIVEGAIAAGVGVAEAAVVKGTRGTIVAYTSTENDYNGDETLRDRIDAASGRL